MQYLGKNIKVHSNRQLIAITEEYTISSCATIFFTVSFIGWLWEVLLKSQTLGVMANQGFFRGPWLPIYGAGSVLMLVIFRFFKKNPVETFLLNMIVCGVLEYLTSFTLEKIYGNVWWDYSREFLNIHGRVCLVGLLLFGIAGCFILYIVGPAINHFLNRRSNKTVKITLIILVALFLIDIALSLISPNVGIGISSLMG